MSLSKITASNLLAVMALLLFSCSTPGKVARTSARQQPDPKIILPAQQVATPANVNFVYDYESIFSPQEEKKLDSLARIFEKSNLIPIKIVTVSDPGTTAENFDERNKAILDEWATVHGKTEKCMAISISKSLRRIRIDYGPFVSRLISDDETKAIIENQFKPSFKQDQFFEGTWNGLTTVMNTIRKNIRF